MARRTIWLVTGAVAGAASTLYAERKLRQTLDAAAARLQPDALAVEVGRTARQAASSTGERLRQAVDAGRQEKKRREAELWTELSRSEWERSLGTSAMTGSDGDDAVGDGADATIARVPLVTRRAPRVRRNSASMRNSPSHLAK